MTFNDVGLSEDGFEFNGSSSLLFGELCATIFGKKNITELSIEITLNLDYQPLSANDYRCVIFSISKTMSNALPDSRDEISLYARQGNIQTNILGSHVVVCDYSTDKTYIIITFDNGIASVYHNNSEVYQGDVGSNTLVLDDIQQLVIGSQDDRNPYPLITKGTIPKFSIYNRALTEKEISDRYHKSTFLFLNDTPTPTQQEYIDWQNGLKIGRQ
jgi:hypothetical protein